VSAVKDFRERWYEKFIFFKTLVSGCRCNDEKRKVKVQILRSCREKFFYEIGVVLVV